MLGPVADAHVKSTSATKNYGAETTLRLRNGGTSSDTYRSYLKFDVTGLASAPDSAKLRLFVTDESPDGGSVFKVANSWTETAITWATPRGRRQLAGRGRRDGERHVGRLRRHVRGDRQRRGQLRADDDELQQLVLLEPRGRQPAAARAHGRRGGRHGDPHGGRRHGPAGVAVDRQGVLPAAARAHGVARRVSATTAGRRARAGAGLQRDPAYPAHPLAPSLDGLEAGADRHRAHHLAQLRGGERGPQTAAHPPPKGIQAALSGTGAVLAEPARMSSHASGSG